MSIPEVTVSELNELKKNHAEFVILDVRNQNEYAICHLNGLLIPLAELNHRYQELPNNKKIIVHCHAGTRAKKAVAFLQGKGFTEVFNLKGGITAWANEIDPTMSTY